MRRFLGATLRAHQYQVVETASAREGLAQAAGRNPEIILLDLGLPDRDGLEVTRQLRRTTRTPIIVISARGQERDKVNALDLGADDYLTKPFGVARASGENSGGPETLQPCSRRKRSNQLRNRRSQGRYGTAAGLSGRRSCPPYPNRIQAAGGVGSKRRPGGHSPAAATGGLGPKLRRAEPLPQSLYGSAPPQARARPHTSATVSHEPGVGYRLVD